MRQPPKSTSPVELDRAALEPEAVVLAHRLDAAAEVDPRDAGGRVEELGQRGRQRRAARRGCAGCSRAPPGWICSSSGRISPRIRPRTVRGVRRVDPEGEPALAAERLGLLAPERQQRPDDAVLAPRLDPLRVPARDEPVEDRLDLVARRVAGGAEPVGAPGRSGGRAARPRSARAGARPARPRRRARSAQKRASASDSAPRRPWSTCSAETR